MIKNFSLAAALVSMLAAPALAGGYIAPIINTEPLPVVPSVATPNWSGHYVGVFGGWANTRAKLKDATGDVYEETRFPGARDWLSDSSSLFGATAGYNFQRDNWVFGPEVEVGYLRGSKHLCDGDEDCESATNYEFNSLYGVIAGRIGYAFDSWLLYGKGGLAVTKITHGAGEWEASEGIYDDNEGLMRRNTRLGLALGAGVEYALNEKISLKGEYMYMDFGKKTYHIIDGGRDWGKGDFAAKSHTVKLGINYRF